MSREQLLAELRRLPARELELTMSALQPGEREKLLDLMAEPRAPGRQPPPFEALVGLSPWLLKAVGPVLAGEEAIVTPASREAIARALEALGRSAEGAPVARARPGKVPMLARMLRRGAGRKRT